MNQNNLLNVVNFMKQNKNFSDYNLINNFLLNLNFTNYRFNNQKVQLGGNDSIPNQNLPAVDMSTQLYQPNQNLPPVNMTIPPVNMTIPPVNMTGPASELQQIPHPTIPIEQNPNIPINTDVEQDETIIPEIENLTEQIENFGENTQNLGINENEECVYKKIRNSDGTFVTQRICSQKIITMPDMFLPKPGFIYSGTNTYTIRKGTILYHANVNKRGFNTKEIKLGKDKLISFFTPNFRLASDKIEGCSIDKQKGFIHVFEVKQDIPDIFVKLPYDTDEDLNLDELKDKFCNGNEYYKGVGFFYPKNEIELFNNSVLNQRTEEMHENLDDDSYYSEFALCAPSDYLTYLYSQKCMSLRKLSQPYRFDGKNYN